MLRVVERGRGVSSLGGVGHVRMDAGRYMTEGPGLGSGEREEGRLTRGCRGERR